MKIKSEKGMTGVDLSIAIIIIILFISLISTLIYNYSKNSKELSRKSVATSIIIDVLEYAKSTEYQNLTQENIDNYCLAKAQDGYKLTATLEELTDIDAKKVIVIVKYMVNKEEKSLEIYTTVKNSNNIEIQEPIWSTED